MRASEASAPVARSFAWVALAAAIASCAGGHVNRINDGHEGAPGVRRVLLCPLNLVLALRPEIQRGAKPVDAEIVAYLESLGLQLARLDLIEGRKLWKQSVVEAKAAGSITRASGIFVAALAQEHEFDVVVMPSLILHQVHMDAGNASWDGVTRRMRIANAPPPAVGRNDSTLTKGLAYGGITGPAWVTSLHILVFARDGSRIFEGRGGMELAQEIEQIGAGRSFKVRLRPNREMFLAPSLLHEGVVRAFTPYLTPPDA